jgi:hypothetical protein
MSNQQRDREVRAGTTAPSRESAGQASTAADRAAEDHLIRGYN